MRTFNLKGKIANAVLSLSLLVGIGVALSGETHAQWRNDDYYRRQRDYERQQRRAQREYERQQRRAERQARRNGGYNDGYYRNNSGYGNYGYRTRDGYGNYGGSFDLRQTALNAGYNNGMEQGRRDRERGDRFDYTDEGDYRSATKDYSSRLGDRYAYQRYFREAFQNGYRDGYYGNTGYGNYGYYPNY